MLIHAIGGKMQQNGWDNLAQELQKEDFAVLAFDLRGHGNSTSVVAGAAATATTAAKPGFWDLPNNRQLAAGRRSFNPSQPPKTIDYHDFDRSYYPMLANDIMAAKLYLDERNDANECNSSRLILIGAQEGAALGQLWMYAECNRFKVLSVPSLTQPLRVSTDSEAEGLACGVWLSMSPTVGNRQMPIREWLESVGVKHEIPMGFFYGERDQASANFAKSCVKLLQTNKANRTPLTAEQVIKGTDLKGSGLLTKDLDTVKVIVNYLKEVRDKNRGTPWKSKKTTETAYYWNFPRFGLIPGKEEKDEQMNLLPLNRIIP
jgi:pimeloyl-ACP methyl ester carboxylesterase